MTLITTLEDISSGLETKSWMRLNDPIHDYRLERRGDMTIIHADSEAALKWCYEHLPEELDRHDARGFGVETKFIEIITTSMDRDKLMSDIDVAEAEEELVKQAWANE